MTTTPDTPAPSQPQRGGIELLPLLMVGAVAIMLAIAGRIDRGVPKIEAAAPASSDVAQVADASSASELSSAFEKIGRQLSAIHLKQ